MEALYPRKHGIPVEVANRMLSSVTDLEVLVHYDCGAHKLAPKSGKWADLAATDAEDEDCIETTAGGRGVLGPAPESGGLRASSPASVARRHADGHLGNAPQVLGRREGLASATPSRDL